MLKALIPLDHDALSKKVTPFDHRHLTVMALAWATIFGIFVAICAFMTDGDRNNFEIVLSIGAITIAWSLLHFIGATHYTHVQCGEEWPDKGGLRFPCGMPGLFVDMLYFSFTLS